MNTILRFDLVVKCIEAISKNKNVVDLACADGWAGKIALECGAKSVKFADARPESFILPVGYTNYQHTFIDLNFPKSLEPLLLGADIVIYFGHLYHCNNHEEILDALINSDCTDFFIDTKIGIGDFHVDLETPAICWYNPEIVSDPYNGWHSTDTHIKAGSPNLSWMIDYFNRHKLEVKLQKNIDDVFLPPQREPYHYRNYIFHVSKSKTFQSV